MVKELEQLWSRGAEFLGSKYAILGGAMSWISEHKLISAITNAGGFGVIACGSMSPELLKNELKLTQELVKDKTFGVNIVIMHPQMNELIDVCIEAKVSHIILAGGIPTSKIISHIKHAGIKVISFTPNLSVAKRLIKHGIDALIIEGMEAGGHIGPVSTSVLSQEILPPLKNSIPIFVAGGIGHGAMIANYLRMGASGCQMGTIFACAKESIAHINFKNRLINANSRDATVSIQLDEKFPVIPVRAVRNKATDQFMQYQRKIIDEYNNGTLSKQSAQLKIEHYWVGSLKKAVIDGDIELGSLMAGQSVGMVKQEDNINEIISTLIQQAQTALLKH